MRGLYIKLSDGAFNRLGRRATDQRRPLRDQAAVELERALAHPSVDWPIHDDRQSECDCAVAADREADR